MAAPSFSGGFPACPRCWETEPLDFLPNPVLSQLFHPPGAAGSSVEPLNPCSEHHHELNLPCAIPEGSSLGWRSRAHPNIPIPSHPIPQPQGHKYERQAVPGDGELLGTFRKMKPWESIKLLNFLGAQRAAPGRAGGAEAALGLFPCFWFQRTRNLLYSPQVFPGNFQGFPGKYFSRKPFQVWS